MISAGELAKSFHTVWVESGYSVSEIIFKTEAGKFPLKHYTVFCFTISAIIGDLGSARPRLYPVWFAGNADKCRRHK